MALRQETSSCGHTRFGRALAIPGVTEVDRSRECGVADSRIGSRARARREARRGRAIIRPFFGAEGVTVTKEDIEAAALQLPERERARLAELLLASLDEEDEIASAWADEAERRFEELKSGTTKALPADEVLERIRSRLR